MQVMVGLSVELANTHWTKNEVMLDETDLKRLLIEFDIDPETPLSTRMVFQILETEAQRLLMAMMISRYSLAMKSPENIAQMQAYQSQRDVLLTTVKNSGKLSVVNAATVG